MYYSKFNIFQFDNMQIHRGRFFTEAFRARLSKLYILLTGLLLSAVLMQSCKKPEERIDDVLLARAYNSKLYLSEVTVLVPPSTSPEDSISLMHRYVENWVRQQVFLHHAMQHLNTNVLDIEKKVKDYRNSLLIFAFENEMIKQRLDTLITDQQIAKYYEENQQVFKLRENIVKVKYAKVPLDAPEIWRLRQLYRLERPEDLALLEEYCIEHAASYFIETDTWLFFQDLLREIPVRTANQEDYIRSNRYIELTDDYFRYFLHIIDYRLKGDIAPLVLERENVKGILLTLRRHEFINEQRNILMREAIRDGRMETFLKGS